MEQGDFSMEREKRNSNTDVKSFQEALNCEVNSALITCENHSPDTIFFDPSYRIMEQLLREYHYNPVGICKNIPYNEHRANQIAFVYRYEGELYWCHLPEICWMSFLMEINEKK
jgi:hypothetical protein